MLPRPSAGDAARRPDTPGFRLLRNLSTRASDHLICPFPDRVLLTGFFLHILALALARFDTYLSIPLQASTYTALCPPRATRGYVLFLSPLQRINIIEGNMLTSISRSMRMIRTLISPLNPFLTLRHLRFTPAVHPQYRLRHGQTAMLSTEP